MASKAIVARAGRGFYAPRFSRGAFRLAAMVGTLYLRLAQGVCRVDVRNMEELYQSMGRFQRGETRLILLFRHVSVADGPVVIYTVVKELQRWCRAHRKPLPQRPHTHFLYGRDVLNWAGAPARWAFPRLGGIPVMNGRMDRESQGTIRSILADGDFPLAFAPEGQVTYHQFQVFPLAAGAATLASWAHRDVSGRDAASGHPRVEVLPVAVGYRYERGGAKLLRKILHRLDRLLGLGRWGDGTGDNAFNGDHRSVDLHASARQMVEATARLATDLEGELGSAGVAEEPEDLDTPSIQERIDRLCEAALSEGERTAGLRPTGSTLSRVFALRYWIMTSQSREDVDPAALSEVARQMADRRAGLAAYVRPYERLADILEYIDVSYLAPLLRRQGEGSAEGDGPGVSPPGALAGLDRLIEYGLNLLDVINRASGGDVNTRFSPGGRTARIVIGAPLDASALFLGNQSAREAMRQLNSAIITRFRELVGELEFEHTPVQSGRV